MVGLPDNKHAMERMRPTEGAETPQSAIQQAVNMVKRGTRALILAGSMLATACGISPKDDVLGMGEKQKQASEGQGKKEEQTASQGGFLGTDFGIALQEEGKEGKTEEGQKGGDKKVNPPEKSASQAPEKKIAVQNIQRRLRSWLWASGRYEELADRYRKPDSDLYSDLISLREAALGKPLDSQQSNEYQELLAFVLRSGREGTILEALKGKTGDVTAAALDMVQAKTKKEK